MKRHGCTPGSGRLKSGMKLSFGIIAFIVLAFSFLHSEVNAQQMSVVPLPPQLTGLPTIWAEPWLSIDAEHLPSLEGGSFDRQGNLFVTHSLPPRTLLKVDAQKHVTTIFDAKNVDPNMGLNGTAIHKDGRIFVCTTTGELLSMSPDGSNVNIVKLAYKGKPLVQNDLLFDAKGNLFVTDFVGNMGDPSGGVYYVSTDGKSVTPVLTHLMSPNGVSLSPDGKTLWIAETAGNALIRADFQDDGVTLKGNQFVSYVYHETGWNGLDSNRVDADGNVYQAMHGQGRILVFNKLGIPIANILVRGRDEGRFLNTNNLAFKPGTKEGYIMAGGVGGAIIFKFEMLAPALPLFSHQ